MAVAVAAVVAVCVLPFAIALARGRLVRRLAVRNARRRPVETVLVIVGSLFGAAIITGSLVVADTLDWSIRQVATGHLGPIDEVVSTRDPRVHPELLAAARTLRTDGTVDGVLGLELLPATLSSGPPGAPRTLTGAQAVEVDFDAARRFGGDPGGVGLTGPTPEGADAVVNEDVAQALELSPGDRLSVHAYGRRLDVRVQRIVPTHGVAGFRGTNGAATRSRNVFVAPGSIDRLAMEAFAEANGAPIVPPERVVAVSNPGGVTEGAAGTDDVTAALERTLGSDAPPVVPLKQDVLRTAADTSQQLGNLFAAMGAFGILAGVLLMVNLFVMLAEERRSELGTLRALGMPRSRLVATFASEGWLYSMVASVAGAAAGVGLGRVIVAVVSSALEGIGTDVGVRLQFSADASSVATGFSAGLVISVATVVATSVRAARLNVIRAIRAVPDPPRSRPTWAAPAGLAVALAAGAWSAVAIAGDEPYGTLLGPVTGIVAVAAAFTAGDRRSRTGSSLAAVAVLAWAVIALRISLENMADDPDINVFVVQGVVLTAAAVALVAAQQGALVRAVGRLARGRRWLAVRIGLAHPTARLLRTALTVAMYALVVFTLTFVTVLAAVFDNQLASATEELSGEFAVLARWPATSVDALEDIGSTDGVAATAPLATMPISVPAPGERPPANWLLSGFDEHLVELGAPSLADRGSYRSDELAYRAVLADPSLAIVDPIFSQLHREATGESLDVGARFRVSDPFTGGERTFEVAALARTDLLINGALVSTEALARLSGAAAPVTRAYVAIDPGTDATQMADRIMAETLSAGVEATAIADTVAEAAAVEEQFFTLARGYLGLGLVVGIAGVGVVMVRAVRDRRREIGVLRSLGFSGREVGATLIVEAAFVSVVGAVVGGILATATAYNVITGTDLLGRAVPFTVPVVEVIGLASATVAVSLLATALPARAAAAVHPAVALRISD